MEERGLYRLSRSTAVEPLVDGWVAWAHVLAPAASSLYLRNYQIGLLSSYLKDPRTHVEACKVPRLRSGRFVDIPEERASEVRDLLADTESKRGQNLRLAQSIIEFQERLVREAKGYSLEPFYAELPPELSGHVELVYDYNDRPIMRFYESLLYESSFYDKSLQSLRLFRQKHDDHARPFFMNTPRLPAGGELRWPVPFDSPRVDELFALDYDPKPLSHVRELFGPDVPGDELLLPLLAQGRIAARETWAGPGARLRYFGHAGVLVEWQGTSILTDPCLGLIPAEGGAERFTYQDLPEKIDYVLITHNHHDHFCVESLLRLRHRIGTLVVPRSSGTFYGDLSLKLLARKIGFKKVVEIDTLESIELPDGEIVSVPFMGEHADLPHGKTAYVVRAGNSRVMFAADSDCLDLQMYRHIRRILGPIQTVFLGMECVGAPLSWSCGPFLPRQPERGVNQSRRYKGCDSARGLSLLEAVGAQRIYIYAMGLEPWLEYLLGLAYTPDAPQIAEANKLLSRAREKDFLEARLLSGKYEFYLPDSPEEGASRAAPLAELPLPYPGLVMPQRRQLSGEVLERQLAYWRQRLADAPHPPTLSDDPTRPRNGGHLAAQRFRLRAPLVAALRELGLRYGATLYMTLLAGYVALLHLYTGADDLVVGTPLTIRNEDDGLTRCFVNTAAVRVWAGGGATFAELLGRVREAVLGAQANADAPFEEVEREVRGGGRAGPLFNAWFVLQQSADGVEGASVWSRAGLGVQHEEIACGRAEVALCLREDEEERGCMEGELTYGEWVMDAGGAREMAGHFAEVLGAATRAGGAIGILEVELGEAHAGRG